MFAESAEFDAEAFFGIKEENLASNAAMGGIDDDLMLKAIQIMTSQDPQAQARMLSDLNPRSGAAPSTVKPPKHSKASNALAAHLPDIGNKTQTNLADEMIKPKSFNNMQNTTSALMKQPGSRQRSDSISELDLTSAKYSHDGGRGQ